MSSFRTLLPWYCALVFCGVQCKSNQSSVDASVTRLKLKIIDTHPHDPNAFTQGLLFHNGFLYESTGQYGFSTLRKVSIKTGKVIKQVKVSDRYFAEGLVLWRDTFFQLTWKAGIALAYKETESSFEVLNNRAGYPMEGWGLTSSETELILSDGSDTIFFLEPTSWAIKRSIKVTFNGLAVTMLNELEYVNGRIYANVWKSNEILVIDPKTGQVTGQVIVDPSALLSAKERAGLQVGEDVLNGIAYDKDTGYFYITGKRWPKLFVVTFPNDS